MRTQVTFDCADPHAQAGFWAQVYGTSVEPRLFFQRVPEHKISKNRGHLDVHVDPERKTAEVHRLVGLGARLLATHDDRGPLTYILQDPKGNEFCLH